MKYTVAMSIDQCIDIVTVQYKKGRLKIACCWDKFLLLAVRFALFDASQNLSQQPCILFKLSRLYV